MKKNIFRISAVILFISAASGLFFLNESGLIHEMLKTLAAKELKNAGLPIVLIEKIEGNILSHIEVINIRLDNKRGIRFSAERISLDYFLPSVILGDLFVKRIVIENPSLTIRSGIKPQADPPVLIKPARKNITKKAFVFNNIEVKKGRVILVKNGKEQNTASGICFSARLSFSPYRNTASVRLLNGRLSVSKPDLELISAKGEAEYRAGSLALSGILLEIADSNLKINGVISNNFKTLDLKIDSSRLSPDLFIRQFKHKLPAASGIIRVKGRLNNLEIDPKIYFETAKLEGNILLDSLTPGATFQLRISGIEPHMIAGMLATRKAIPLRGKADIECSGTAEAASLDKIKLDAFLEIKGNPGFDNLEVHGAKMGVRLEKYNLTITNGSLDSSAGKLEWEANGDIPGLFNRSEKLSVNIDAKLLNFDISAIGGKPEMKSRINSTALFNFTVNRGKLSVKGDFNILETEIAGVKIGDSVIFGSFEKNTFTISKAELFSETGNISFSGYAGLENNFSLNYTADIYDLNFLETLMPGLKPVKGSFSSSGELKGSKQSLKLKASIEAKKLMYGDLYAENGSGTFDIILQGTLPDGNAKLSFDGIDISGRRFKSLRASVSGNEQKMGYQAELTKTTAIKYGINGYALKENKEYFINIDNLETVAEPAGWKNDGRLLIKLSKNRITFDKFLLTSGEQKISMAGEIGLKDKMDIVVKAESVELAGFNELTLPEVKLEGRLNAGIKMGGAPDNPSINGSMDISGGGVSLPQIGIEYRNIRCGLLFRDKEITVSYFDCRSGNDSLNLSGEIITEDLGLQSADLSLDCSNFPFAYPDIFSARADCLLKLKGSGNNNLLTGDIAILKSDINIPSSVKTGPREIEIVENGATRKISGIEIKQKAGVVNSLGMDVNVSIPGNSWVRWNEVGLDADVKGALNVKKNRGKPFAISGEIYTTRGSFKYLGQNLTIDEGSLIFTGGKLDESQLDIRSSKHYADFIVNISVSGTLNSPRINLSSDPEADRSDIISYLMFGKAPDKLNDTEASKVSKISLNVLGTIASRGIRNILGNQLAPEIIEIQPVSGGTIGVGKYITNKLFVKYEWTLNYEENYQTIIDYQLNRYFNLHSQTGNTRTSGIDIFWNYSY